jgi:hypothetical protein
MSVGKQLGKSGPEVRLGSRAGIPDLDEGVVSDPREHSGQINQVAVDLILDCIGSADPGQSFGCSQ